MSWMTDIRRPDNHPTAPHQASHTPDVPRESLERVSAHGRGPQGKNSPVAQDQVHIDAPSTSGSLPNFHSWGDDSKSSDDPPGGVIANGSQAFPKSGKTVNALNSAPVDFLTNGFVLDNNNNGKYDAGTDGVVAFDLNHDGQVDGREIDESSKILNARNTPAIEGHIMGMSVQLNNPEYLKAKELGLTGTEPITAEQLAAAGGRVLVQEGTTISGSGMFRLPHPQWGTYSVYNNPGGAVQSIDPQGGYAKVTQQD